MPTLLRASFVRYLLAATLALFCLAPMQAPAQFNPPPGWRAVSLGNCHELVSTALAEDPADRGTKRTWEGDCVDNLASGKGTLKIYNPAGKLVRSLRAEYYRGRFLKAEEPPQILKPSEVLAETRKPAPSGAPSKAAASSPAAGPVPEGFVEYSAGVGPDGKPCRIRALPTNAGIQFRWHGACRAGIAEGQGVMVGRSDGVVSVARGVLQNGRREGTWEVYTRIARTGNIKAFSTRFSEGRNLTPESFTNAPTIPLSQVPEWAREVEETDQAKAPGSQASTPVASAPSAPAPQARAPQAAPSYQPPGQSSRSSPPSAQSGSQPSAACEEAWKRYPESLSIGSGCGGLKSNNDRYRSIAEPILRACGPDHDHSRAIVESAKEKINTWGRSATQCGFRLDLGGVLELAQQMRSSQTAMARSTPSAQSGSQPSGECLAAYGKMRDWGSGWELTCQNLKSISDGFVGIAETVFRTCGVDSEQGQATLNSARERIRIYGENPSVSGKQCGFRYIAGVFDVAQQMRSSQTAATHITPTPRNIPNACRTEVSAGYSTTYCPDGTVTKQPMSGSVQSAGTGGRQSGAAGRQPPTNASKCLVYEQNGMFRNQCDFKVIFTFRTIGGGCYSGPNGAGSSEAGPHGRSKTGAGMSCGGKFPSRVEWATCKYDDWVKSICQAKL